MIKKENDLLNIPTTFSIKQIGEKHLYSNFMYNLFIY